MIVGVGVDIIEVRRIGAAVERPKTGARFRVRVFTPEERAYCERRRNAAESFAARFAAKEAVMKALGRLLSWRDVEVVRTTGPPGVRLHGRAAERAQELGVRRITLSLSHTADLAIAYVIAESE